MSMNFLAKKLASKIMYIISDSTEVLKWWRPYKEFADLKGMLTTISMKAE